MADQHEKDALEQLAEAKQLAEQTGQPQLRLQLALGTAITHALLAVAEATRERGSER